MATRTTGTTIGRHPSLCGAGVGFRREIAKDLLLAPQGLPHFIELAPENWIGVGGRWGRALRQAVEKYPVICHGLSLSIGSPEAIDRDFLLQVRDFLREVGSQLYSEHLSFSKCDNAHLYDLLPIPFREEAIERAVDHICEVQDVLGEQIAIENVSYYASVAPEMDEATFLREILQRADCLLLLDVNNVYVNSFNHGYDAHAFIESLPLERVAYIHMAGHEQETPELIIDTHGRPIVDPVYELLEWTLPKLQPCPILLERDHNVPDYGELEVELKRIQEICDRCWVVHV